MLASEIITEARYILSDTAKDRWTDTRLLSLLNDAIIDTAKNTTLFVENLFYVVQNLVVDVELQSQALKVLRAEYLDEKLPFYTFDEMDQKFGKLWQQVKGDKVEAIVYDRQRNAQFKLYPVVENAINSHISYSSAYGIITDISYSDILPNLIGTYGDVGDIPDEALIKFYYIRRHAKISALTDTLQIDELLKNPLQHYVAGMALRDNQDTQNRNMANEELKFYYAMIEEYNIQKSELFVRTVHEARYRPND